MPFSLEGQYPVILHVRQCRQEETRSALCQGMEALHESGRRLPVQRLSQPGQGLGESQRGKGDFVTRNGTPGELVLPYRQAVGGICQADGQPCFLVEQVFQQRLAVGIQGFPPFDGDEPAGGMFFLRHGYPGLRGIDVLPRFRRGGNPRYPGFPQGAVSPVLHPGAGIYVEHKVPLQARQAANVAQKGLLAHPFRTQHLQHGMSLLPRAGEKVFRLFQGGIASDQTVGRRDFFVPARKRCILGDDAPPSLMLGDIVPPVGNGKKRLDILAVHGKGGHPSADAQRERRADILERLRFQGVQ